MNLLVGFKDEVLELLEAGQDTGGFEGVFVAEETLGLRRVDVAEAEYLQGRQQVSLEVFGLNLLQTDEVRIDGGDLLQNEVLAIVPAEGPHGRVPTARCINPQGS